MHLSILPAKSLLHRLRGRRSPTLDQLNLTLSAVLDQSPACIIITDLVGRVLYVNPGFSRVTGYSSAEVLGRPVSLIKSSRTHADTFGQLWRALREKGEWHGELLNQRKNGESYWVAASVSTLRNEEGVVDRYLSIQDDISLRKHYEAQLFHRSNYDLLTDLPNRELIQDRLQQALDMAESQHHQVAVLFVNLLQFRRVNETQGHEVGDRLLCQAAQRLQQVLSPLESLGRVGGDEFVIIMPEVSRLQAVEHLSRCVLQQLTEPFRLGDAELHISACIGVSLGPEDGDSADALLRHADAAMQQVRSRRESGCCFFREEMNAKARDGLAMERALHEALACEAFELWYQPLLDLKSDRLQGVEALVRWRRGADDWVLPDQFIPQAEESGQIIGLGRWVLKTAVHQAAAWQCVLNRPLEMAVNVSPREMLYPGFVDDVAAVLRESGIMSGTLTLEITESIFMEPEDESRVVEILERLRGLGVKLAIDDFGTGFSALGYLKRFPVDVLKIDREFVRDIHVDMNAATLCQAIIWMAKGLQMGVVAEGVECAEQLDILRQSGARSIQGYHIAKPLESKDVLMFISKNDGYIEE
ncbi:PAS domain S-box-containing protein/diguanylate cyclase (GGDEF)-like protein [Marinobacterium halophilum]|uniref:PAS domain S-box-containing protein/diguanylate cyclase (GGDEF)-like protein n=1 Tax=Marinobacterium halophilum TaxID=267374 RepID=A0A2P8ETX4_9GAMM|nr:EAL domain-containing protein [Marinobacterium halophilum]PSL12927.1 PAS domain S-box-containing protein/diguanylate cyclase (GGDEF)-like protein [Marinobacterium halophilum]